MKSGAVCIQLFANRKYADNFDLFKSHEVEEYLEPCKIALGRKERQFAMPRIEDMVAKPRSEEKQISIYFESRLQESADVYLDNR